MKKPKFKIDDIVCMKDDHHFNPASNTLSIGKIEAIHIRRTSSFYGEKGIIYSVTGFSLMPSEDKLKRYK